MTRYIFILLMAACLQAGEWNNIGTVTETVNGEVTQLTWLKNSLYVRGTINRVGPIYPSQHMARWLSGTWYDVGTFTTTVDWPNYVGRPGGNIITQWDPTTKSLLKYRVEDNYSLTLLSCGVGNGGIARLSDPNAYSIWFKGWPHYQASDQGFFYGKYPNASFFGFIEKAALYDNSTTPYARIQWSPGDSDTPAVLAGPQYYKFDANGDTPGWPAPTGNIAVNAPGAGDTDSDYIPGANWLRSNMAWQGLFRGAHWNTIYNTPSMSPPPRPSPFKDATFSLSQSTPAFYNDTTLANAVPDWTALPSGFGSIGTQCFNATRILTWDSTNGFKYVIGSLGGVVTPSALPSACVAMVWLDSPARIYAATATSVYWTDASGTWTSAATVSGGAIRCLATGPNGSIFVGGDFTAGDFGAGSPRVGFIMATNGQKYGIPGGGVNDGRVNTMVYDSTNGVMVLGGTFTTVGTGNYPYACLATLNPAPVDVSMVPTAIDETAVVGTVAGALTAQDPTSSGISFSLVSGTGSDDNALFGISGSNLVTAGACAGQADPGLGWLKT